MVSAISTSLLRTISSMARGSLCGAWDALWGGVALEAISMQLEGKNPAGLGVLPTIRFSDFASRRL